MGEGGWGKMEVEGKVKRDRTRTGKREGRRGEIYVYPFSEEK